MNIISSDSIALDSIKLGKIFTYHGSNQLCNLYYNNEPFYLHTPTLYIPYGVLYFQNSSKPVLEMTTDNEKFDSGISKFKEVIRNIEARCEGLYQELYEKQTGNSLENSLEITSQVKKIYMRGDNKFLIPINKDSSRCILVEYPNRKKSFILDWEKIPKPTYGIAVVHLRNFWVRDGKCGVNWVLEHVQVMPSHVLDNPSKCQGTTVEEITESLPDSAILEKSPVLQSIESDPIYGVYFKMRKMGIPLEAVQNKMRLNGHDPTVILQSGKLAIQVAHQQITTTASTLGLPPPPPPLPSGAIPSLSSGLQSQSTQLARSGLLSQISGGGFQLKKVSRDTDKPKKKLHKTHDLNVPSLDDILGGLSKLKKVEIPQKRTLFKSA
jgi:hypothetical protein